MIFRKEFYTIIILILFSCTVSRKVDDITKDSSVVLYNVSSSNHRIDDVYHNRKDELIDAINGFDNPKLGLEVNKNYLKENNKYLFRQYLLRNLKRFHKAKLYETEEGDLDMFPYYCAIINEETNDTIFAQSDYSMWKKDLDKIYILKNYDSLKYFFGDKIYQQ